VTRQPPEADRATPRRFAAVEKAPARLRKTVHAHLGSEDVSRVIYGSIIGLALTLALALHPPAPGVVAASLVGSAIAVGLAEAYSEIVAAEARTRQRVSRKRVRHALGEAAAVIFGASFPAVFFVLAAVGAIDSTTAFRLARWTGLAVILGYGYLAARLAGARVAVAMLEAAAVGAIGLVLIIFKALLH
jgi:hypothetical protein